jgi:Fe-S cluster assembly protein SufD
VGRPALDAFLASGAGAIAANERRDALARFEELPVRRVIRSSRGWKRDLEKVDLSALEPAHAEDRAVIELPDGAHARGVVALTLSQAVREHAGLVAEARGSALDVRHDKFASLTVAFQNCGAFVFVPAGVQLDGPILVTYSATARGLFPYTLVVLQAGASATVVERIEGEAGAFVCGVVEVVAAERATARVACVQSLADDAVCIAARGALLGADARLEGGFADMGAGYAVSRTRVNAAGRGSKVDVSAFFFADGARHIDVESEVDHVAADTTSQTLVRTAGTDRGQGRYVGTIRIHKDAHGADASLRDDALLLSKDAHVDSVPALEIAANDVKAFHGATVGAISEDEIFYAQSRGIARADAERMIALGFFEPAVSRFPGEALREQLRDGLASRFADRT